MYPNIKNKNFHKKINKIFAKYKINKKKRTMEQICYPTTFKHQQPQEFVAKYINPKTPYKGLLIFHSIGAGKTCSAVNIGEHWKKKRRIIVVVPASLRGNFRKELRSKCAGNSYITESDRKKLKKLHPSSMEYKNIVKKSDKLIDKYYDIWSYNKFIDNIKNGINLKNKVLIIDEIQNMISESGSYYKILHDAIKNAPNDLRIILLSATPIFDKPIELALTMNLLRLPVELPTGGEFYNLFMKKDVKKGITRYKTKNMNILKNRIKGHISYFRGAPPYVYPMKEMNYVPCRMREFQYKSYLAVTKPDKQMSRYYGFREGDILKLPRDFMLGGRFISNIAYPNKGIGQNGYDSLKPQHMKLKELEKYSVKFHKMLKKIKKCNGTIFIYSNFLEYGGLKPFIKILEYYGFKNYVEHKEGKKRYATWTGDDTDRIREEIKTIFNKKDNYDGSKIKILLGSPSIKEGVSLLRVQQVHIMEPYWNISRVEQVIGRAVRYCSHKDMPKERRKVEIYMYITYHPYEKITVDQYIQKLALNKHVLVKEFEQAMKEAAVDCELNKHANVFKGDKAIKCMA